MTKQIAMGKLPHDVEIFEVTPTVAKEYLDGTFDRNRPIVENAVAHYTDQMRQGNFLVATPLIVAIVETTNRCVLVDGQHRLSAIIRWKNKLTFTLLTYYLKDEDQLADLYACIDVGRSRNLTDNVRAQGFEQESGLSKVEATRFVSSILWAERKDTAFMHKTSMAGSYADQIENARGWLTEGTEYFRCAREATGLMKKLGRRKPIVACGLITFRGQPNRATQFWRGVFSMDNIAANDPRGKLHHKIIETSQDRTAHGSVGAVLLARIICTCWNAYITNRQLTVIKPIKRLAFQRCNWREEIK